MTALGEPFSPLSVKQLSMGGQDVPHSDQPVMVAAGVIGRKAAGFFPAGTDPTTGKTRVVALDGLARLGQIVGAWFGGQIKTDHLVGLPLEAMGKGAMTLSGEKPFPVLIDGGMVIENGHIAMVESLTYEPHEQPMYLLVQPGSDLATAAEASRTVQPRTYGNLAELPEYPGFFDRHALNLKALQTSLGGRLHFPRMGMWMGLMGTLGLAGYAAYQSTEAAA